MGRLNQRKHGEGGELPEGWSQPEAQSAGNEWTAPGNLGGASASVNPSRPFSCRTCGTSMLLEGVHVKDGETYCFDCSPKGAVTQRDLPAGPDPLQRERPSRWRWLLDRLLTPRE